MKKKKLLIIWFLILVLFSFSVYAVDTLEAHGVTQATGGVENTVFGWRIHINETSTLLSCTRTAGTTFPDFIVYDVGDRNINESVVFSGDNANLTGTFTLQAGNDYLVAVGDLDSRATTYTYRRHDTPTVPVSGQTLTWMGGGRDNAGAFTNTTQSWHIAQCTVGEGAGSSSSQLNISTSSPGNNTQFNKNYVDFNLSVNATSNFNASLFINGTLNKTLSNLVGGQNTFVNFTTTFLTGKTYNYFINVSNGNATSGKTSVTKTFFIDSVLPTSLKVYLNNSVYSQFNLTAQFNISDDFSLFSYNLSLDGTTQLSNRTGLTVKDYTINLSLNTHNLALGNHTLILTYADGHTAEKLLRDYQFNNGLFDDYSKYTFYDGNYIKTKPKLSSIFDKWSSTRLEDRYTQTYTPSNPSSSYTFIEESTQPIHIIKKEGYYNGQWIIIGNHWKDYVVKNEPNAIVDILRINANKVEVTISNLKNPEQLVFQSIGDLNVVTEHFGFIKANLTTIAPGPSLEFKTVTYTLEINYTDSSIGTNATFIFASSSRPIVKETYPSSSYYTSSLSLPDVTTTTNFSYHWDYILSNVGDNESGSLYANQTVLPIALNNCSTGYDIRALNITVRNESDEAVVRNSSIDGFFTAWTSFEQNSSKFNVTWKSGISTSPQFGLCLSPNSSTLFSNVQLQYRGGSFSPKTYYFTNVTFDNASEKLNLYLTDTTSLVTIKVVDISGAALEGAIVKVLSYDIGTDSSVVTEIITTDSDGFAFAQMVLNSQYYIFVVEFEGNIVFQSLPTVITSTSRTITVNLGSNYFDSYTKARNMEGDVTFTNSTLKFTFIYTDTSGLAQQGCLRVTRSDANSNQELSDECEVSASATLSYTLTDVGTNSYFAVGYIKDASGQEFTIDTATASFDFNYKVFGRQGLFIGFLLVLFLIMVGIWNPMVATFLGVFGLFMLVIMKIIALSWGSIVILTIMAFIVIYRMTR